MVLVVVGVAVGDTDIAAVDYVYVQSGGAADGYQETAPNLEGELELRKSGELRLPVFATEAEVRRVLGKEGAAVVHLSSAFHAFGQFSSSRDTQEFNTLVVGTSERKPHGYLFMNGTDATWPRVNGILHNRW